MSTLPDITPSTTAAIGEYIVLAELLKRGRDAYLAHGPTQKGWDIVSFNGTTKQRVQVKTVDWTSSTTRSVQISTASLNDGLFDYLVVVLLNRRGNVRVAYSDRKKQTSLCLVFKANEVESHLSPYNPDRPNNRTLSVSLTKMASAGSLKPFEDRWDKIR